MYNVQTAVSGDKLTITVDLKAQGTMSRTGKSTVVASTEGNMPVHGDFKLGLNVFKPRN